MFRKIAIVMCVLGAAAIAVAWAWFGHREAPSRWTHDGRWLNIHRGAYEAQVGVTLWGWGHEFFCGIIENQVFFAFVERIDAQRRVTERSVGFYGFDVSSYKLWRFPIRTGDPPLVVDRSVWAPVWFPLVVFSAYPTLAFIRGPLRRRRRRRRGLCLKCGYDLTGNTSGVCPECGQPMAEKILNDPHANSSSGQGASWERMGQSV